MDSQPEDTAPPRYTDLELPRWSCLPSHVALADFERLRPATENVPDRIAPAALPDQLAFRYGVDLYNTAFYWEAHEVWEPVWMALPPNSRERSACQALIQAANALLKLRFGRARAFGRLAAEVARHAGEATAGEGQLPGLEMRAWNLAYQCFAGNVATGGLPGYGFSPVEVPGFPFLRVNTR
jgi:hypothetical protein